MSSVPLTQAVTSGDAAAVTAVLADGADVNERTGGGQTPLILATIFGHTHLISLLLDAGADPQLRDNLGLNAVDWAQRRGATEALDVLSGRTGTTPSAKFETSAQSRLARTTASPETERPRILSEAERSRRWIAGLKQRIAEQSQGEIPDGPNIFRAQTEATTPPPSPAPPPSRSEAQPSPHPATPVPPALSRREFRARLRLETPPSPEIPSEPKPQPEIPAQPAPQPEIPATPPDPQPEIPSRPTEPEIPSPSPKPHPQSQTQTAVANIKGQAPPANAQTSVAKAETSPANVEAPRRSSRKRCPQCNATYNSELLAYCAHHVVPLVDADTPIISPPPKTPPVMFWVFIVITLTGSIVVGSLVTAYFYNSSNTTQQTASSPSARVAVQKGTPTLGKALEGKAVSLPIAECPLNGQEAIPGTVEVRVVIDRSGQVTEAEASGGDWLLRGAAAEAAMKSTFAPEKLRARETEGTITYTFEP